VNREGDGIPRAIRAPDAHGSVDRARDDALAVMTPRRGGKRFSRATQRDLDRQRAEWSVEVHPHDHTPIRGRLCTVRLPEEEANKVRDRLRREEGPNVSPRSLEAAAWLLVFTTAAAERMTTREALDLYRLRWQVELEIRRDKSLGGLNKLPNFRPDTIATWLLGKLLIHQIARKAVSPSVAFPPSAVGLAVLSASERDPRETSPPPRARRC
jgi:hypothetical protein